MRNISNYYENEVDLMIEESISSQKFLNTRFNDITSVLLDLSCINLKEIIIPLFKLLKTIIANISIDSSRLNIARLCVMCDLLRVIVEKNNNEALSHLIDSSNTFRLKYSSFSVLSKSELPFYKDIKRCFSQLLQRIAQSSSTVLDNLVSELMMVLQHQDDPTLVYSYLTPFFLLSSDIGSAQRSITVLFPQLGTVNSKYRDVFSRTLFLIVARSIKSSPDEYISLFTKGEDLSLGHIVLDLLSKWITNRFDSFFISRFAILYLLPMSINKGLFNEIFMDVLKTLKKATKYDNEIENILVALSPGIIIVSKDPTCSVFGDFTLPILSQLESAISLYHSFMFTSHKIVEKAMFISLPLYYLVNDSERFNSIIKPIFIESIPNTNGSLICRFVKQASYHPNIQSFIHILSSLIIIVIEKMYCEPALKDNIRFIFKSMTICPLIIDHINVESIITLSRIMQLANQYSSVECCFCLMSYLNKKRVLQYYKSGNILNTLSVLSSGIGEMMISTALYCSSLFTQKLPEIVYELSDFVLGFVQAQYEPDTPFPESIVAILNDLEIISLLLLSYCNSDVCKKSIDIISNIIKIVHHFQLQDNISIPIEAYQALVNSCKNRSTCLAMQPSVLYSLKLIKKHSSGTQTAWNTLYQYFLSLLRVLCPQITMPSSSQRTIYKPVSMLQDELPNCFSLIMALLPASYKDTVGYAHSFIERSDIIGQVAVECIPSSLLPQFYSFFTLLVSQTIAEFQPQPNIFEISQRNSLYVMNALKIMHNILRQPFWDEFSVTPSIITQLSLQFTGYCNLVSIGDMHELCAHYLISLMNRYPNEISIVARSSMVTPLSMWLSKPNIWKTSYKNTVGVIFEALSLILNGLEFYEQNNSQFRETQSLDRFRFLINIAISSLQNQSALKSDVKKFLISLIKNNVKTYIELCIEELLSTSSIVKEVFIGSIASVITCPPSSSLDSVPVISENLINILFEKNYLLIETTIDIMPFSRAESFGIGLLEASVIRNDHYNLIDFMITMELKGTQDSSKNSIFRGNGVSSRAVGHFPRLFGKEWIQENIGSVIEYVISEVNNGKRYQIFPNKLKENDNLLMNRESFRNVLLWILDKLLHSLGKINHEIIKVVQMLYNRINELFPDHGVSVVFGFLFLRFILPAFTNPSMIFPNREISESVKDCLIYVSVVLMASSTRGTLEDKNPAYHPFNDIAILLQEKLSGKISELVVMDLDINNSCIPSIDEVKIVNTLLKDLSFIQKALEMKVNDISESDPVYLGYKKLIKYLRTNGNTDIKGKEPSTFNCIQVSPFITQLSLLKPPQDIIEKLGKWFFKENEDAVNIGVYYLVNSCLPKVIDFNFYLYHIYITLMNVSMPFYVLLDAETFDRFVLPKISILLKFFESCPPNIGQYLNQIVVINPCSSFIVFLMENQKMFPQIKKLYFAKDIKAIHDRCGNILPKVSTISLESLSIPESIHSTRVNNHSSFVRLHEKSIQILRPCSPLAFVDGFSHQVVLFEQIVSISELDLDTNSFQIRTDSCVMLIQTSESSNLHSLLITARNRSKPSKLFEAKVSVENRTIQWLLLNIAFASLVSSEENSSIYDSAFQLVVSTYQSFNFKRTLNPISSPPFLIPKNCFSLVSSLSLDISNHNPIDTSVFLKEFFKMVESIPEKALENTLYFLAPWIELLVNDINCQEDLLDMVFSFYFARALLIPMFNSLIWVRFNSEQSLSKLYTKLYSYKNPSSHKLTMILVTNNPSFSTCFWVDTLIRDQSQFSISIVQSLILSDLFEDEWITQLLYYILSNRDRFHGNDRIEFSSMLENIIRMVYINHTSTIPLNTNEIKDLYIRLDSGFDEWCKTSIQISNLLVDHLYNLHLDNQIQNLFQVFCENMNSRRSIPKFFGSLYSSSFCFKDIDCHALKLITTLDNMVEDSIAVLCYSLANLKISKSLSKDLVLYSSLLLLVYGAKSSLYLLSVVISKLEPVDFDYSQAFNQKLLLEIESKTGLLFQKNCIQALAILYASYDSDYQHGEAVSHLARNDTLFQVLSCQYHYDHDFDLSSIVQKVDYDIAAPISFLGLMRKPKEKNSIMLLKYLMNCSPCSFSTFKSYNILVKWGVVSKLDDPEVLLLLSKISNIPKQFKAIPKIFDMHFVDGSSKTYEDLQPVLLQIKQDLLSSSR